MNGFKLAKMGFERYANLLYMRKFLRNTKFFPYFYVDVSKKGRLRSLIESQLLSLPVVVTDAIGIKKIIPNGITGFFVKIDDMETFVKSIKFL